LIQAKVLAICSEIQRHHDHHDPVYHTNKVDHAVSSPLVALVVDREETNRNHEGAAAKDELVEPQVHPDVQCVHVVTLIGHLNLWRGSDVVALNKHCQEECTVLIVSEHMRYVSLER